MLTTLSVIVTDESRDGPALQAAAGLAQREDAHLAVTCLGVEPMPIETISMEAGPVAFETDRAQAVARADALVAWARAALPGDLRVTIDPAVAPSFGLVDAAVQAARFSDLAVTARPYGSKHARVAPIIAEALLFGTGVPVLVVPDAGQTDWRRPFRRLALAWNGSEEAMRAARAALPLLRQATQVEVAVIHRSQHGSDEAHRVDPLLHWLARHGVSAQVSALTRTERRKADILAHFARDRGCDVLVMGAYGHSRMREALLGGTTRDMLAEVPLPLFMAH